MMAVCVGQRQWILALTIHHIIADGWSLGVLLDELGKLHDAEVKGTRVSLPSLPVQLADVAAWQREQLASDRLNADLRAWVSHLAGLPTLELPTDRRRPPTQTFAGAVRPFRLGPEVVGPMRELAAQQDATLFMGLLTGFAVLLARYSGQDEVPLATFTAGRNRPELEPLIGFLVNTLVLRLDLRGDPTFREALRRTRGVALDAYARQEVPFERLVEALAPPRDPSRNPLVQVAFQLFGGQTTKQTASTATPEWLVIERGATVFDMVVTGWEFPDGSVTGRIEFNTDLYDESTIERMLRHYERVLTAASAAMDRPVSELQILAPEERAQLDAWNDTSASYPDEGLVELLAAQAARTPDTPALIPDGGPPLSYRDLGVASDQLALYLGSLGVGSESIVGLCAERSPALVIGVLGILKAGGAYLPLDPANPRERLAMVVNEARPAVILAQRGLRSRLPASQAPVVWLDAPLPNPGSEPGSLPTSDPQRLAYVIFTSGSTGTPKGAMNTTAGIVNRLHWMQERFRLDVSDRVVLKTPISFDVSVWEMLWPLLTGATIVIAKPGGHGEPRYLIDLFERQEVTTAHFVPSMLRAFLAEPGVHRCAALRRIVCSGEALPLDLQRSFFEQLGSVELHNLYGPTEAAIDVTAWQCDPADSRPFVPIGRPIANIECHVVDVRLRPQPIGVPGELCLAGIGLARGYLNRPELTADRFVADPLNPERRFYRTGDRARWTADGVLEYLGRLDTQVKIRGVRIEIAEVEHALHDLPDVAAAAVDASPDPSGGLRLVAYVVPPVGSAPTLGGVRDALGKRLPDTFLPAALVLLDRLPLTTSGKLDRRALPDPKTEPTADAVPPRDALERLLADVWAELLVRDGFGVHDNFFELGGHSLLATQVVSRIRTRLGVDLPLRLMFERPTIAGLAALVRNLDRSERVSDEIVPLERRSGDLLRHLHELSDDEVEIALQVALEQSGETP
jgi:amino acid adenylation domain-containing protein